MNSSIKCALLAVLLGLFVTSYIQSVTAAVTPNAPGIIAAVHQAELLIQQGQSQLYVGKLQIAPPSGTACRVTVDDVRGNAVVTMVNDCSLVFNATTTASPAPAPAQAPATAGGSPAGGRKPLNPPPVPPAA